MNKGLIAAATGIALMSVGWVAIRWTAPETTRADVSARTPPAAANEPAPVVDRPAVVDDPVPLADLGAQAGQIEAYTSASGAAGELHRLVATEADASGLLMRDRVWLHRKVDRWLSTVEGYQEQVASGEMSADDAATNADEDLEALARRLGRRTPEVRDAVIDALASVNP